MKEEQNAVSSSNYDVPLFHAKMPSTTAETKMLKWSTPTAAKNGSGLCPGGVIQHCASATRITPVDVNRYDSLFDGRRKSGSLTNSKHAQFHLQPTINLFE